MNEIIENWKVNEPLMERVLEIKKNEQRKIKRGFALWLKYIRAWK